MHQIAIFSEFGMRDAECVIGGGIGDGVDALGTVLRLVKSETSFV